MTKLVDDVVNTQRVVDATNAIFHLLETNGNNYWENVFSLSNTLTSILDNYAVAMNRPDVAEVSADIKSALSEYNVFSLHVTVDKQKPN